MENGTEESPDHESEISLDDEEQEVNEEDDDLLSEASTESHSPTPEDLVTDVISRPQALCLALVFEELVDKLIIVGNSIPTAHVDVRSRSSVDLYEQEHRPVLRQTIPAQEVIEGQQQQEEEEGQKVADEQWIIKQHHGSVIPHKLTYIVNPRQQQQPSLMEALKRSGIKSNTESERNQKIRVQLQLTANALITELVLESTFTTLNQRVQEEQLEKRLMLEQFMKVNINLQHIQEIKAAIKQAKRDKVNSKTMHMAEIHNMNDLLLEQSMRTQMEDKYVRKRGTALVATARRNNVVREENKILEFQNMKEMMRWETYVHESMMEVIERKLLDVSTTLEIVVEKYEKDFNRLNADLEKLYRDRKRDLERIQWLIRRISDYERVVMDNRRIKQRESNKERKKMNENKKAIKIQAWWRGLLVTKRLGPFKQKFLELQDYKANRAALKAAQKAKGRK